MGRRGQIMLTFIEAFMTVMVAGLGGVMMTGGPNATIYTWPSAPALVFIAFGAMLAGVRRVQSLTTDAKP